MWFLPKYRATGNGRNVRTKPPYFDIMFEYWGSKAGYSQETLLSSDEPNRLPSTITPADDCFDEDIWSNESSKISSDNDGNEVNANEVEGSKDIKTRKISNFSRRLSIDAKKKKIPQALSHAESILRWLEAVGTGLQSLGGAMSTNHVPGHPDVAEQIKNALDRQTDAIERMMKQQADQMAQVMQMFINRDVRES
ncbi:hypothetical protein AC1031_018106 [Aphanomyces cochlioides]|nr:hypothetical protein AC1031_018106 [Aphanomyces cochlioides]